MKNEVTFDIEQKKLNLLIQDNNFEDAETLCTRMLNDYNQLDYELLLKRARVRQCQMKYEDAALDANLALHVLPNRIDAYQVLSEFLLALNNQTEALKLLEILHLHFPENIMIKAQYEQIKEKERKKLNPRIQQKNETKAFRQNEIKQQNMQKTLQIKEFVEANYDVVNSKPSKTINEFYNQTNQDDPVLMSDELNENSDQDLSTMSAHSNDKAIDGQHIQPSSAMQPLDFSKLSHETLFAKKKEVYKMKPEKLSVVQCQLCQFIFDYSSSCSHYSQLTQSDLDDLKDMMPGIAGHKDMDSKKQALQKVTKSLDVLSTFKITSLTLLQGQFSEIIALYLKRDLSILLGENSQFICKECCPCEKDSKGNPQINLAQHALIIVNRTLTFQQQALMLNQKEDLINVGGLEEEKANFKVEDRIQQAILEELKIELDQSQQKGYQNLNFLSLQLLARAVVNILILNPEQQTMFKTIKKYNFIPRIMKILNSIDNEMLTNLESKAPQVCLFIVHALRFLIVCHSIDQQSVLTQEEPAMKYILRKLENYDLAFPQNTKLFNALKGDYVWLSHTGSNCSLKNFYKDPQVPLKVCGSCKMTSKDLKACSRCLKVFYCNRDCQKADYVKHKHDCQPIQNQ